MQFSLCTNLVQNWVTSVSWKPLYFLFYGYADELHARENWGAVLLNGNQAWQQVISGLCDGDPLPCAVQATCPLGCTQHCWAGPPRPTVGALSATQYTDPPPRYHEGPWCATCAPCTWGHAVRGVQVSLVPSHLAMGSVSPVDHIATPHPTLGSRSWRDGESGDFSGRNKGARGPGGCRF